MSCQKHTSQPSTSRSVTLKLCLSNESPRYALRPIRIARLVKLLRSYEDFEVLLSPRTVIVFPLCSFQFHVNHSQIIIQVYSSVWGSTRVNPQDGMILILSRRLYCSSWNVWLRSMSPSWIFTRVDWPISESITSRPSIIFEAKNKKKE